MGAELVGCQVPQTPATHLCLADMWSQETGFAGVGAVGGGWGWGCSCSSLCFQMLHLPTSLVVNAESAQRRKALPRSHRRHWRVQAFSSMMAAPSGGGLITEAWPRES